MSTRNRHATETKIRDAATQILKESGFEDWGVNAIAREAGVDKVLLYRYFKSLDGLLSSIIENTDFWPDPESLPADSPMAFIDESISRMQDEPHARVLMSNPRFSAATSAVKRRFSARRDNWINGLMDKVSGTVSRSFAERLSAFVYFQASTGIDDLSFREFLNEVDWQSGKLAQDDEELPVELL